MAPLQPRGRPNTRRHQKALLSKQPSDQASPNAQDEILGSDNPELEDPEVENTQTSHANIGSLSDNKVYVEAAGFKWDVSSLRFLLDQQVIRRPASIPLDASILSPANTLDRTGTDSLNYLLQKLSTRSIAIYDLFLAVVKNGDIARHSIAALEPTAGVHAYLKRSEDQSTSSGSLVLERISTSDTIYL